VRNADSYTLTYYATANKVNFSEHNPRRIRVGYMSRRFEKYPGTQLMLRLFGAHDRAHVQVFCYATGPGDGSEERATVERDCDVFRDLSLATTKDSALAIAGDGIHILVDYDGHHDFNNLAVFIDTIIIIIIIIIISSLLFILLLLLT
jgi:predicted O-linked N-acetylglucosamine transferase (SPINDLY family)